MVQFGDGPVVPCGYNIRDTEQFAEILRRAMAACSLAHSQEAAAIHSSQDTAYQGTHFEDAVRIARRLGFRAAARWHVAAGTGRRGVEAGFRGGTLAAGLRGRLSRRALEAGWGGGNSSALA